MSTTVSEPLPMTIERRAGGWAVVLECPRGCSCGVRTATGPFMSEQDATRYRDVLQDGWARGIPSESIEFPPSRHRVTGDLFHGRVPKGAVYVGRQAVGLRRSPFANPFTIGEYGTAAAAVAAYRAWLLGQPELLAKARAELSGKNLACWCGPDQPCHADVLLALLADRAAS